MTRLHVIFFATVVCPLTLIAQDTEHSGTRQQLLVFDLKGVDPETAIPELQKLVFGDDEIRVDASGDRLFLRGTREQAKVAASLLKKLASQDETTAKTASEFHVFRLNRVDATEAVRVVQTLLADGKNTRVEADPKTNQLLIYGSKAQVAQVRKVLELLGEAGNGSGDLQQPEESVELKIFYLTNGDASDVSIILNQLFRRSATIIVDRRLNAILAQAPQESFAEIAALVDLLDRPGPKSSGKVPGNLSEYTGSLPNLSAGISAAEADITDARAGLEVFDEDSHDAAREYRELQDALRPNHPKLKEQSTRLRLAVASAFEARQALQLAEVAGLRDKLAKIQQRIRQRESLKDKIIERRVADLIAGEDLSWARQSSASANDRNEKRDAKVEP